VCIRSPSLARSLSPHFLSQYANRPFTISTSRSSGADLRRVPDFFRTLSCRENAVGTQQGLRKSLQDSAVREAVLGAGILALLLRKTRRALSWSEKAVGTCLGSPRGVDSVSTIFFCSCSILPRTSNLHPTTTLPCALDSIHMGTPPVGSTPCLCFSTPLASCTRSRHLNISCLKCGVSCVMLLGICASTVCHFFIFARKTVCFVGLVVSSYAVWIR